MANKFSVAIVILRPLLRILMPKTDNLIKPQGLSSDRCRIIDNHQSSRINTHIRISDLDMMMGLGGPTLAIDRTTGILTRRATRTMLLPPGEGVNGIFDAYPKVVNTSQVVETNVNMCPMNSSLQIPRPPLQEVGVGARLMHFVGQWEEISVDTYILEVVRSGYCLEFKELPPPTGVIHTSMPGSIEKVCVIEKEILTLLQKNAIEKVPENEKSLGFYSTIFLTKKKSGGLRPILNLSNLNLYLQRFHFRMETLRSIIKSLQQGE